MRRSRFRFDTWTATALVALLAAIPPLLALHAFGVIETPDTPTYLDYARIISAGPLPEGEALLREGPAPATLFRTIGFPALLAGLQALSPEHWRLLLVGMQILAQSAVAAAAHRAGLAFGLPGWLAALAALMPAAGYAVVVQVAVLTDALYGALFSLAAIALLRGALGGGRLQLVALAGLLLGIATFVREATPYLMVGLLPLAAFAAGRGRRIAGLALFMAPVVLAVGVMLAEMQRRAGDAFLSTSRQIVMVQAVLPLLARGIPVYDGDDLFDRTARETVAIGGYVRIDEMNARLFAAGMTAPEIAATASSRYARTWRRHPVEMLRAMAVRLPVKMFWMTFKPVDTAAELHRQSGDPRPWFGRPEELLKRLWQGSPLALLLLAGLALGRAVGLAVAAGAIAAPALVARRDPRFLAVLGGWLACAGFVGVYLPVHIEQRYLVPIVPLLCLLGAVGLREILLRLRARRRGAP
jgi:hypothetical protein